MGPRSSSSCSILSEPRMALSLQIISSNSLGVVGSMFSTADCMMVKDWYSIGWQMGWQWEAVSTSLSMAI